MQTITLSPEEAARWAEITFAHGYEQEKSGVWDAGLFDQMKAVVEAVRAGE